MVVVCLMLVVVVVVVVIVFVLVVDTAVVSLSGLLLYVSRVVFCVCLLACVLFVRMP